MVSKASVWLEALCVRVDLVGDRGLPQWCGEQTGAGWLCASPPQQFQVSNAQQKEEERDPQVPENGVGGPTGQSFQLKINPRHQGVDEEGQNEPG